MSASTPAVFADNPVARRRKKHWKDDALLARLGYKSQFRREFSLLETIAFAFSIMGISSAVSTSFYFPLVAGGHAGMIFGWLIPCFFVLCIACCLAELTSSMPTSAGLYYFSAKLAPEKYSALASWITGWANITGQVALVCSIGTNGVSTADAFTLLENNTGWKNGTFLSFKSHSVTLIPLADGWAFLLAFTAPMWCLTGYDAAAHISEETAGAARSAPIAIMTAVIFTEVFGWLFLISASYATTSVDDLLASELPLPMGQLFLNALGKKGMLAIWCLLISIQWVNGISQGVDASRVIFAFARDNALPGSRWWKQINPYTQTPVNAVWLVMACTIVLGLFGFSDAALSSLAGATVVGIYTSYGIPIFLRITSGRGKLKPGPFSLGKYYMPIGIISVAWIAFVEVLLLFPYTEAPAPIDMNYAIVLVAAVLLFASASWVLSARKWFTGPVPNVERDDSDLDVTEVEVGKDEKL
ncbi:hypothetical protein PC9H_006842 [Pleurotus ostreatus]|uniref:Amino acid transporter n=1 Tax=Pleurotus ostreatus TaxID=5322 RepID=A0A8H6ZYC9_PLEOS|nr:uncharacterized protein PC9H_006842 [Pleurotus ostreatus]KAF7431122.1 hypothetical protein PC9H_006842 [Pleurotus ostreatus]